MYNETKKLNNKEKELSNNKIEDNDLHLENISEL